MFICFLDLIFSVFDIIPGTVFMKQEQAPATLNDTNISFDLQSIYILFLYLNELSLLFYIYIDQKGYYTKFLFETPFILKSFKILSSCISKATYSIIIIFLMDKLDSFSCFLFSWSITYAHACCSGKRIKFTWLNPIK